MNGRKYLLASTTGLPLLLLAGLAANGWSAGPGPIPQAAAAAPPSALVQTAGTLPAAVRKPGARQLAASDSGNPCAAKNPCNPCAAKNPCNPCAANPCAANPCAANPCNPCAAGGAATSERCIVPRLASANPCAAKNPCNPCAANPCNPCAAKNPCNPCAANPCAAKNPCNPCAANPCAANPCAANPCAANPCAANPCAANPCAAKNPCAANPCAAANPCNPCAANPCAANPCAAANPCNPCAANPCNPCAAGGSAELTDAEAVALFDCLAEEMADAYAKSDNAVAKAYTGWKLYSKQPYVSATHGSRYVLNYASPEADNYGRYEEAGTFAAGAKLAKPSFTVSGGRGAVGPLFLMEKMSAGFSEASGDWRYTMIMPNGQVVGTTNGQGSGNVAFCADCHSLVTPAQDSVYLLPEEYRVEQ